MPNTPKAPRLSLTAAERQKAMKVADTLVKSAAFLQKLAAPLAGDVGTEIRACSLMCIASAEALVETCHPAPTAVAIIDVMVDNA